ncbi:hypothetical protein CJO81_25105 (plasmid) [Ralstonia solanacearum]|nr:hypothetical protein CJO74_23930 [Ralstonia solanacearum]AXV98760.1 hypothetical protein CJO80_25175 [Ralstonia solanacearum]AXW03946.1 hypothetical protein CJO81_25105 [Ralstonia solanacearum]AXW13220.1 hypothetical protein CJO83_22725 [Ralstonia solanacearum]AXW31443.1 hypothetical protein CJO87_25120 [Ralstonia solanacearum]
MAEPGPMMERFDRWPPIELCLSQVDPFPPVDLGCRDGSFQGTTVVRTATFSEAFMLKANADHD